MGLLRIIYVDGADNTEDPIYLRPNRFKQWRVIDAIGFHTDDGGNQSLIWFYKDHNLGTIAKGTNVVAANVRVPLSVSLTTEPVTVIGSMFLRYNLYAGLGLASGSLGSGKVLKIRAFVEEEDYPLDY